MGNAFRVCMDGFRRWTTNPRIYVIASLALLMLHQWVRAPIIAFASDAQAMVSPWYYPFLMEDWYLSMMVQIGAVLLFCDAPFFNEGTPYLIIRAGRRNWFLGQILYVALAALLYQVFLAVNCGLIMLPRLEFTGGWGKVLGTLAQTDAGEVYGMPYVRYATMMAYSPAQGMALSLLLSWNTTMIFGMAIFTVNLYLPRIWGPIFGLAMTMISSLALNFSGAALYWFSPGSWMTFSLIGKSGLSQSPTLTYILIAGPAIVVALAIASYRKFKTSAIETLPTT